MTRLCNLKSGALTLSILLTSTVSVFAHTNSVGYENAGPGSVTFWYGSWHPGTNFTEGSLQVVGPAGYNNTQLFSLVVQTKPTGLIDGVTNFYSDGTSLVGTPAGQGTFAWQGATLDNLVAGDYTFTYIPIAFPTATWDPKDNIILSNTVTLDASIVSGATFLPLVTGSAATGAAGMLDDITGTATGNMADAITTLQGMSEGERQAALKRIAPQTSSAINSAASSQINGSLDSVAIRLDTIRAHGFVSSSVDKLQRGEEVQLASLNDFSAIFQGDEQSYSFWSKAFGSYAKQGINDGFSGYHAKTGGASFGADMLLDRNWILGAAATYARTDVEMEHFRSGDDANINSYQITGYSSYDFGQWYMEGMAAAAYQDFSTTRNTGLGTIARGDFDGMQYAARVTAGTPINLPDTDLIFTPSAGVEWNYLTQDSYMETGAGGLNMMIDDVSGYRLRSVVQAKFHSDWFYEGYKIVPSLQFGWRHEFHDEGITSTATFTGGGGQFYTPGQEAQDDSLNIGGRLDINRDQDFTFGVQLDSEMAESYQAYALQLIGQWRF